MYAYPATMSDRILDAIAEEEQVVKYVDMPLQHASDAVLARMKRPTGRGNLRGMVERVRERVPGVAFRTSFIVGFPGETDAEFEELLGFVREAEFDHLGVFTFSDEEGTTSFDLPGRVSPAVKERRRRRLLSEQKRISTRRNKAARRPARRGAGRGRPRGLGPAAAGAAGDAGARHRRRGHHQRRHRAAPDRS